MLPLIYIPDTSPPFLVRWYVNRETFNSLLLYFNEPVTLSPNASFAIKFIELGNTHYPFNITSVAYADYNTQVTLNAANRCIPSANQCLTSLESLFRAATDTAYLLMSANSVFDFAAIANGNIAITDINAIVQGAPGKTL